MNERHALSDGETELMKAIWSLREASVPGLVTTLNERRPENPITRGTVQVLLNRVEAKGWLRRRKEGRGFLYEAAISESEGLGELASQFRSKVFDGSALNLVQSLVKAEDLGAEDIDELRALLDQAEGKLKKGGSK